MTDKLNTAARIRDLNDALRVSGRDGSVLMTPGVAALPDSERDAVVLAVRGFDAFTPDNDPYGEHDCASLMVGTQSIIWKINYYDPTMTTHSDDPTDRCVTRWVLSIMLASEY